MRVRLFKAMALLRRGEDVMPGNRFVGRSQLGVDVDIAATRSFIRNRLLHVVINERGSMMTAGDD